VGIHIIGQPQTPAGVTQGWPSLVKDH
jgi:hypothetical protein